MNKVSRLLPLLAFVALLFACASKTCKIEGSIEGKNNGDTLLLITDMENGVPFDTIFLKDGKFSDEVPVDSTTLCFLKVTGPEEFLMPFFLESGTVKINIKENMTESTIGGTKLNNEWQKLNQAAVDFQNKMVAMQKKLGDPPTEEAKQQFLITMQAEQAKLADKYYKTAEKNIGNELGYVLTTNPQLLSEEQVLRLINKMPAKMHARKEVQQIEQYLKTMPQEMEEDAIIPDFSANDPNGKTVSAMEVIKKSKLTIIDFWASWCQPCMQEMPHMVQIYNLFHPKGLDILGVSLDRDGDAWRKAIKETGAVWTQISELDRNSKIAQMFGVNAIPFTLVVDKEGAVLASGLLGNELEDFIRNQLEE